jgi:hypothetical protein
MPLFKNKLQDTHLRHQPYKRRLTLKPKTPVKGETKRLPDVLNDEPLPQLQILENHQEQGHEETVDFSMD